MSSPAKVAKNTIGLTVIQFFIKGLSAVWTFYLARRLGVRLYGLWANILALVSIFGMMQGLGILAIVIKDISQRREDSNRYLGASLIVYGAASVAAFLLVVISSLFLGYRSDKFFLSIVAALGFIAFAPANACQSILYGNEDFILYNLLFSAGTLSYMLIGVGAVEMGFGVAGALIALVIGYLITSLLLIWKTVQKFGPPVYKEAYHLGIYLARLGFPLVLSGVLGELMLRSDRILIDHFLGESSVGYYQAAFNILYMPREIFLIPFITAVSPKLYASHAHEKAYFDSLFTRVNIILLLVVLPIVGFCLVFPEKIIWLFYGKGFKDSAVILPYLSCILIPLFIISLWQTVFVIRNRTNSILLLNLCGTVFSISFNYFFLPRRGIIAAAWSAILTQCVMLLLTACFLRNEGLFSFWRRVPKLFLAFTCSTVLLFILRFHTEVSHILFFLLLIVGSVSYVLFILFFGAVTADEKGWFKEQFTTMQEMVMNKLESF